MMSYVGEPNEQKPDLSHDRRISSTALVACDSRWQLPYQTAKSGALYLSIKSSIMLRSPAPAHQQPFSKQIVFFIVIWQ
jgi:hypothetical protein